MSASLPSGAGLGPARRLRPMGITALALGAPGHRRGLDPAGAARVPRVSPGETHGPWPSPRARTWSPRVAILLRVRGVGPPPTETGAVPTPEAIASPGITSELGSLPLPVDTAQDEGIIASFLAATPQPLAAKVPAASPGAEGSYDCRQFWIRFANTDERREKAALLIARMYASQGYKHEDIIPETCHAITLISHGPEGNVIATITISMDSPEEGLLADQGHRGELDRLRAQGKRLCEFNGFAVDPSVRSRLALARLFHIAMLYPGGLLGCTDCVIEVSPRHAGFYERMLLFKRIGEARICLRVGTVGVLLHADFRSMMERLEQVGGLMEKAAGDRSLYPYGFSKADADGILGRLKRMA